MLDGIFTQDASFPEFNIPFMDTNSEYSPLYATQLPLSNIHISNNSFLYLIFKLSALKITNRTYLYLMCHKVLLAHTALHARNHKQLVS